MTSKLEQEQFLSLLEKDRMMVDERCTALVEELVAGGSVIDEAVRYSLLSGGKRIRPILCLWTHRALAGGDEDACLDVACAIECLHTYSLVHDDLPCMDDDDIRRGQPSSHKKFGEDIAVLTGDALLTLCFEIVATLGERWSTAPGIITDTIRVIARAAGADGLILGQALDLAAHAGEDDLAAVDRIHYHKTAVLIAAAMEVGAVVAGASKDIRGRVSAAGLLAGRAFQIADDLLDLEPDPSRLGKTPGKDEKHGKLTYPSLAGSDGSRERARVLIEDAKAGLDGLQEPVLLAALFDHIVERSA